MTRLTARTRLRTYELQQPIGEGGMGVVYRARDTKLGRDVAVKVLSGPFASDPERLARFEREARVLAALDHSNITTIHEIGEHEGVPFIVMELVEGRTLDACIGREGMPLGATLKAAIQMGDALARAHAAGIVHRDIKPGNIMITPDWRVKILDLGLAKLVGPGAAHDDEITRAATLETQSGVILGTVAYMSPSRHRA